MHMQSNPTSDTYESAIAGGVENCFASIHILLGQVSCLFQFISTKYNVSYANFGFVLFPTHPKQVVQIPIAEIPKDKPVGILGFDQLLLTIICKHRDIPGSGSSKEDVQNLLAT